MKNIFNIAENLFSYIFYTLKLDNLEKNTFILRNANNNKNIINSNNLHN